MNNLPEIIKKAESGDPEAQYEAAIYILYEVKPDNSDAELVDRALGFLKNAAMSGYNGGEAALRLGHFFDGNLPVQDYKQAVIWYRTATLKLEPMAYFFLGLCYYFGKGVEKDFAKAFDCFFKSATQNFINAYYMLGDMFKKGEFVEHDPVFAFKLYQYVSNDEMDLFEDYDYKPTYPSICLRLGEAYLYGIGVERNIEKANHYFSEAKEYLSHLVHDETPELLKLADDAPFDKDFIADTERTYTLFDSRIISESEFIALMTEKLPEYELQYYPEKELNELYAANPVIADFDDKTFTEIYDKVKENNPISMYEIAIICCLGDKNVPGNPALFDCGVYFLHQSALRGCKNSVEMLGLIYHHGKGVIADYAMALFLYNLSESSLALGQIGVCYAKGQGVEKDYKKAYQYFVKSLLVGRWSDTEYEDEDNNEFSVSGALSSLDNLHIYGGWIVLKNLITIYSHLTYFDRDQAFIDFCYDSAEKYQKDNNAKFYGEFYGDGQ